jgi:hypothetical protein
MALETNFIKKNRCELAAACHFLPAGMKLYRSRVSLVWNEARSIANFNQARAIHPQQGTLRK